MVGDEGYLANVMAPVTLAALPVLQPGAREALHDPQNETSPCNADPHPSIGATTAG